MKLERFRSYLVTANYKNISNIKFTKKNTLNNLPNKKIVVLSNYISVILVQ